jgi:hypothetical protein
MGLMGEERNAEGAADQMPMMPQQCECRQPQLALA